MMKDTNRLNRTIEPLKGVFTITKIGCYKDRIKEISLVETSMTWNFVLVLCRIILLNYYDYCKTKQSSQRI